MSPVPVPVRRINKHHSGDLIRVISGESLHVETATGMTSQHVRSRDVPVGVVRWHLTRSGV